MAVRLRGRGGVMVTATKGRQMSKHPDSMMTPAQIARRKFKSMLPRKIENRTLSPMQALGETFTLLDKFRDMVQAEKPRMDPAKTVYAALAYTLPNAVKLALTLPVPDPGKIGPFCESVFGLARKNPTFLGLVFIQVDLDTKHPEYKAVSFVVPFKTGANAEARLHFAQKEELTRGQKIAEGLKGGQQ
jgi:hypothetical protein